MLADNIAIAGFFHGNFLPPSLIRDKRHYLSPRADNPKDHFSLLGIAGACYQRTSDAFENMQQVILELVT